MNVHPSPTQWKRVCSPDANTCVTTMLVATSVPAALATSFRKMGSPARVRRRGEAGRQRQSRGLLGQPRSPNGPSASAFIAECSSELYTEPSGYISSLEYPQPYPPDLRCNYSIRVERGLTVHLKFLDPFEIDDHQQVHCPYDQLQVQLYFTLSHLPLHGSPGPCSFLRPLTLEWDRDTVLTSIVEV